MDRWIRAKTWFVDTSVVLAAMLGKSAAAKAWLDAALAGGDALVGSRLLEVEVRRFLTNKVLAGALRPGAIVPERYLDRFELCRIDDDLLDEAIAIQQPLRSADAIHVAAAWRLGPDEATIVTHDAQRSRACQALGFAVVDPVTDDPHRPAVA
jgi:predicted nucleic acid-binding protein